MWAVRLGGPCGWVGRAAGWAVRLGGPCGWVGRAAGWAGRRSGPGGGVAGVASSGVDDKDVGRWFGEYLVAFAACGRGERETDSLLEYYGVPLLITTDGGFSALSSAEQVVSGVRPQIAAMREAGYDRSEVLDVDVALLNQRSALLRGSFSWQRADGSEFHRLTASYLVTEGPDGRRISALAVHGV